MSLESEQKQSLHSSRLGRKWLTSLNRPEGTVSEEISISIPDVSSNPALSGVTSSDGEINHDLLAAVLAESAIVEPDTPVNNGAIIRSDLAEPTTDWKDNTDNQDHGRSTSAEPTPPAKTDDTPEDLKATIDPMIRSILERFPIGQCATLLFVGSERNLHVDETCARICEALSERNIGRILMIDSNLDDQELTKAAGMLGQSGISDVVNRGDDYRELMTSGSSSNLSFLPSGAVPFKKHRKEVLRAAVNQMKSEFQFVCIAAGDAHRPAAKFWNDLCDGSYLVVNMKNTHEVFAKSAVTELQANGARLLGCIVTDSDNPV